MYLNKTASTLQCYYLCWFWNFWILQIGTTSAKISRQELGLTCLSAQIVERWSKFAVIPYFKWPLTIKSLVQSQQLWVIRVLWWTSYGICECFVYHSIIALIDWEKGEKQVFRALKVTKKPPLTHTIPQISCDCIGTPLISNAHFFCAWLLFFAAQCCQFVLFYML